jgi:hypothetical protein
VNAIKYPTGKNTRKTLESQLSFDFESRPCLPFRRGYAMQLKTKRMWVIVWLFAVFSAAIAQDGKITVLSPRGTPPPIPLVPMAPRPPRLDGKTVYFVDIKYEGGASLLRAIMDWFARNIPTANLVFREKAGSYDQEDTKLWAEIKQKADAVVMAVGH